jgi:hypothetical protein
MSRFHPQTPSRLLAACAVLAAGATLSLAIVLPAQLAPFDGDPFVVARTAKPVAIVPAGIDVVAVKRHAAVTDAVEPGRSSRQQG